MIAFGRQAGFTLVEALVALAILGVTSALVLPLFMDVARKTSRAEATRTAVLLAESKLAEAGALTPLAPGETTGASEPYRWTLTVAPYGVRRPEQTQFPVFEIRSTVRWNEAGQPQSVALQTLRLGQGK